MNFTFPSFNVGFANNSYIKYRLMYNIEEFFEIRFRFIPQPVEQKSGLLMFMSKIANNNHNDHHHHHHLINNTLDLSVKDFISLNYEQKFLHLRLNLGQGIMFN